MSLCVLCFTSSHEVFGLQDYSEISNTTGLNLIQRHFSFSDVILTEEAIKNPSSCICRSCWSNLENFNEFFSMVAGNYNFSLLDCSKEEKEEKYIIPEESFNHTEDLIVYDDESGRVETEMIKVEIIQESDNYDLDTEWIEETEEPSPKKVKRVSSTETTRISRQSTVLDSADDQRIRETANMTCDLCHEILDSLRDAKAHFKLAHNMEGYLTCCERKFKQRCRLVEHVNTHYNYSYSCPLCSKNFDSKSYLNKHMACHDSNKQFQCAHCPKNFSRKFQVRNHLLSVHIYENVEPTFECPIENCDKKFVNYARMKHHVDYTHSTNHIEICEVCSKTFRTKNAIDEHMKTHLRRVEDRIKCELCGHFLADLKSYNRHVKNHSTESMDNTCNYCGKKSPNLNALKKHIKYVHEMTKSYQCRFCEKSFKRPRNLIDHEAALHTLENLYNCNFCSKTFRNQSNMLAHRKKQHPDQYKKPSYMRDDL